MKELLFKYISDPTNPKNSFLLGLHYFNQKYYAEAISFFSICSENSEGDLRYESLLHVYFCYRELGDRDFTLNSILKQTLAKFPDRIEVYFHLAKLCEKNSSFMDGYMYTSLALNSNLKTSKSIGDLQYPGLYEFYFLKAHFAWYVDKPLESRLTYQYIMRNFLHELNEGQVNYLTKLIHKMGSAEELATIKPYNKSNLHNWPYKFNNIDKIERNYSQALQDMFVLYCLDGKTNGSYLEIGSAFPYLTNNTALLEQLFDWKGIGVDFNEKFVNQYNSERKNKTIFTDATLIDYQKLLSKHFPNQTNIDYLQLDIDPPTSTYEVLESIPFNQYKFAVITYEHDYYSDFSFSCRQKSRELLLSKGYVLAVPDVFSINNFPFEDWWVHPDLVDLSRIQVFNPLSDIEWGSLTSVDQHTISREIINENVYEYWKRVQENDVVVDIGCSFGPFACSIMNRKLKHLYCIDASKELITLAKKNIADKNFLNNSVTYINNAILQNENSNVNIFGSNKDYQGITFKELINKYEIHYIDFLKIDIEGGEYDIFIPENLDYLQNNVMFIAAEFHLNYPDNRTKFKYFRDKYLKNFPHHKIISCTTQNIVPGENINLEPYLMDDNFVDNYNQQFMVYISNDKSRL